MHSFDGPPNIEGYAPPDPVGDVGPNHYVAMSNVHYAVYLKDGTQVYPPLPATGAANNTLWQGFGGDCETSNDGDPIVVYDQHADRWILTQFTAAGTDLLQLCCHFPDRRPDGRLLPVCFFHRRQLPGLSEVRNLE